MNDKRWTMDKEQIKIFLGSLFVVHCSSSKGDFVEAG